MLAEAGGSKPRALLIATGSEVDLAMAAREQLEAKGVPTRVVSMPCQEQFLAQEAAWREAVLPSGVTARVSIEAAATFGWQRFLGANGVAIGVDRFGASAPAERIYAEYGLTAAAAVAAVQQQLR